MDKIGKYFYWLFKEDYILGNNCQSSKMEISTVLSNTNVWISVQKQWLNWQERKAKDQNENTSCL